MKVVDHREKAPNDTKTPKIRVLMLLDRFSTISQTYMLNEVEAVMGDYDVRVVSTQAPPLPCRRHPQFQLLNGNAEIHDLIREFRPQVLHAHYLHWAPRTARLAEKFRIPFTLRTHSYDTLKKWGHEPKFGYPEAHALKSDACAGVLAFPFTRPILEHLGVPGNRIIDSFPVVNYGRFYDRSPNGDAILNVGACINKKRMEDFVDLGKLTKKPLNLYAIGYRADTLRQYNEEAGCPVSIHDAVEPDEMPAVYKAHRWLVYTACFRLKKVGWPMAVAEAQAAGLGVCFPNIRPDVAQYVGDTAFLYDSINEVPDIIARPYPDELRERGFIHAKKSDINVHKRLLTDIWDRVAERPPRIRWPGRYAIYRNVNNIHRAISRRAS